MLRDGDGPVHLVDVGATLCALAGACTTPSGFLAGTAPAARLRRFHQYDWKNDYWTTLEIPGMTAYDVGTPLFDEMSWRPAGPVPGTV